MAALVTIEEVKSILDDSQLADAVITTFILGATSMREHLLSGVTLTDAINKEIERYMAAHLITVTIERMAKKAGAGGASIEYMGDFGQGLRSTPYGLIAIAMDNSGTLAAIEDGKKAIVSYAVKS